MKQNNLFNKRVANTHWQTLKHPYVLPDSRFTELKLAHNTTREEIIDALIAKGSADSIAELFRRNLARTHSTENFKLVLDRFSQEKWPLHNLRPIIDSVRDLNPYPTSQAYDLGNIIYGWYWYEKDLKEIAQLELLQHLKNIWADGAAHFKDTCWQMLLCPAGFLTHLQAVKQDLWGDALADHIQDYGQHLPQAVFFSYVEQASIVACEGAGGKRLFARCYQNLSYNNQAIIKSRWNQLEQLVLTEVIANHSIEA